MYLLRVALLTLQLASLLAAADAGGKWKVRFLGDPNRWPKMVSEMTFDFKVEGKELTGRAHMSDWPGDAAIQGGRIDGDRVSFFVVGKSAWVSRGPLGQAASGFPRLTFSGAIKGDEIELHLVWDSVMIYGGDGQNAGHEYDMAGRRAADR